MVTVINTCEDGASSCSVLTCFRWRSVDACHGSVRRRRVVCRNRLVALHVHVLHCSARWLHTLCILTFLKLAPLLAHCARVAAEVHHAVCGSKHTFSIASSIYAADLSDT